MNKEPLKGRQTPNNRHPYFGTLKAPLAISYYSQIAILYSVDIQGVWRYVNVLWFPPCVASAHQVKSSLFVA